MKGERIIAEIISLVGLVLYGIVLQHIYSEVAGHPDGSWINQAKAWWLTRGSRKLEKTAKKAWLTIVAEPPAKPATDG